MILDWIKQNDIHRLFAKLGGVGGSFVASHLVWLTTTPDYASFWKKLYMTAPTITDIPAFERMVAFYFALGWIGIEHFWQRFTVTPQTKLAANPPKGVTP
jgi:hypothetical protein